MPDQSIAAACLLAVADAAIVLVGVAIVAGLGTDRPRLQVGAPKAVVASGKPAIDQTGVEVVVVTVVAGLASGEVAVTAAPLTLVGEVG